MASHELCSSQLWILDYVHHSTHNPTGQTRILEGHEEVFPFPSPAPLPGDTPGTRTGHGRSSGFCMFTPHLSRRPWISSEVSDQPHGQTNARRGNSPGPGHPNSLSLGKHDWSSLARMTQTRLQNLGDYENYWSKAPLAVGSFCCLAGRRI